MAHILDTLSDAQVFARDPESLSDHDVQVLIERLKRHVARMRKARKDSAILLDTATKIKKTNAAAKKKKTKVLAADPMNTII